MKIHAGGWMRVEALHRSVDVRYFIMIGVMIKRRSYGY